MLYIRSSDFEAEFCIFRVFSTFFTNLCNRLLTVGIAMYRVTLVHGSSLVRTPYQRKKIEQTIVLFILLFSFYLTGWAIFYREDYRSFLGISVEYLKSWVPCLNCLSQSFVLCIVQCTLHMHRRGLWHLSQNLFVFGFSKFLMIKRVFRKKARVLLQYLRLLPYQSGCRNILVSSCNQSVLFGINYQLLHHSGGHPCLLCCHLQVRIFYSFIFNNNIK